MVRAVIYNRCSTEEEAQMNALLIQASESREIVINKGWQIVEQYIESESGTTVQKRNEYMRLLEDMEKNIFDIIVIKSIDRLMRSAKDWYIFLDKMTQYNKQLYIYIDQKFYTPDDSLLTGIKAILAEDFSRELSKKIKNAHKRRQEKKSGLNITMPMFGWDKIGKDTFVINEEEAENYRLAFAWAKEGRGFYSIANRMYEKGVRSKKGTMISPVQWRKMLYSERAHGTVILHTKEYDFEAKKRVNVPQGEWVYVENALPPIVTKEYQQSVLEVISKRTLNNSFKEYTRDMTTVGMYDLSGKIFCGKCGKVYYRNAYASGKNRIVRWKCSTALKQGRAGCDNTIVSEEMIYRNIEAAYGTQYKEWFGSENEIIEEAISILKKVLCENVGKKEWMRLKRELYKVEKKKQVLLQKLLSEVISDEEFEAANQELDEKIKQLKDRLYSIKKKEAEYNNYEIRLQKIREVLKDGLADRAKTKGLITKIEKIVVYPEKEPKIEFNKLKMRSMSDCQ